MLNNNFIVVQKSDTSHVNTLWRLQLVIIDIKTEIPFFQFIF